MAYLLNEEENNQQNQNNNQTLQNVPQQGFGQQNLLIKPSKLGTGFTNISRFLDANREAGNQLSSRMVSNVQKDTQTATSGIQNVRQSVQNTEQGLEQRRQDAENIRQAVEASKAGNLQNLEDLSSGDLGKKSYEVVQGITNVNELNQDFNKNFANLQSNLLTRGANLESELGNEYGRIGLVRRSVKSPTYTLGQMALDQTIAEGVGSEKLQQSLIQNRAQLGQTAEEAGVLSNRQINLAQDFVNLANQKREELQNLIRNTEGLTNQQIDELKKQTEKEISEYEGIAQGLLTGKYSFDEVYSILNPNYRPRDFTGISEKPTNLQVDPKWSNFFNTNVFLEGDEVPTIGPRYKIYNPYYGDNSQIEFSINALANELVEGRRKNGVSFVVSNRDLAEEVLKNVNVKGMTSEQRKKAYADEIRRLITETRKANAQDEVYRQAFVNKWLRENFGIDTNTKIFDADVASQARINREGLRDKVTTEQQVRQLNALKRLMEGIDAQQMSLENRGKTAADLVREENVKQKIQNELDKTFENIFSKLKDITLSGTGRKDYEKSNPLDFASGYAQIDAFINALDLLAQTDPETYKKIIKGERQTGNFWYGNRKESGTAGSWADAMSRARERVYEQFGQIMNSLGANRRIKMKG